MHSAKHGSDDIAMRKEGFLHPDPAIRLAMECDVVANALPLGFYSLAYLIEVLPSREAKASLLSRLTPEETKILFLGKLMYRIEAPVDLRATPADNISEHCERAIWHDDAGFAISPCMGYIQEWFVSVLSHGYQIIHPLGWFRWLYNAVPPKGKECDTCRAGAKSWILQERAEFWKALPQTFGLQDLVPPTCGAVTVPEEHQMRRSSSLSCTSLSKISGTVLSFHSLRSQVHLGDSSTVAIAMSYYVTSVPT
ncbi:hypothetical protein FA95DRAFT_986082 [Auriscalpium vulgare]|uniref:Uncharacterized protein n=1 Tax=Auriscalpium vulgare TaxID=40419 RepID=A0ACB8RYH1_9AGAM|nr:hypothetical protein FA95DRAFT_986082 [Auriscalpium vulgare]